MQKSDVMTQTSQQDLSQYADMPVGEILARTRLHYDLSLDDVEKALHIRKGQLDAIETGDLSKLPGRVYAIGFVRTYSEFLGLDGDKIVQLFKAQIAGASDKVELAFPAPASESKLPNKYVLISAFAGLVLFVALLMLFQPTKEETDIPELDQVAALAKPVKIYGPPTAENMALIQPAAGTDDLGIPKHRIQIDAVENAWVEVRDADGESLVSQILKPGDSYLVPDQEGLIMDTGNIGALEFTLDGVKLPMLGELGDVRRKMELSPEALIAKPEDSEAVSEPLL